MVKNPPSNAGDAGSIPGWGTKILHATGQLSPHATTTQLTRLNKRARMPQTTEPMRSRAGAPQLERENPHAATREKPAHHNEEPVSQRKISHATTKTQHGQKKRKKKNK